MEEAISCTSEVGLVSIVRLGGVWATRLRCLPFDSWQ